MQVALWPLQNVLSPSVQNWVRMFYLLLVFVNLTILVTFMHTWTTLQIAEEPYELYAASWLRISALTCLFGLNKENTRCSDLMTALPSYIFSKTKKLLCPLCRGLIFAPFKLTNMSSFLEQWWLDGQSSFQFLHCIMNVILLLPSLVPRSQNIGRSEEAYLGCCTCAGVALLPLENCFDSSCFVTLFPNFVPFHDGMYLLASVLPCTNKIAVSH